MRKLSIKLQKKFHN